MAISIAVTPELLAVVDTCVGICVAYYAIKYYKKSL